MIKPEHISSVINVSREIVRDGSDFHRFMTFMSRLHHVQDIQQLRSPEHFFYEYL